MSAVCVCGHSFEIHQHHRRGTDCSIPGCPCLRYRRRRWWHPRPPAAGSAPTPPGAPATTVPPPRAASGRPQPGQTIPAPHVTHAGRVIARTDHLDCGCVWDWTGHKRGWQLRIICVPVPTSDQYDWWLQTLTGENP